jgi:hypothetical protein
MSIQFAGSKSADDRRRRRLVVNADDPGADGTTGAEGLSGLGVSSELVKSAAAAPWVPVSEFRLWTYAVLIGLIISGAAFALATPISVRPELAPLTKHLLEGDRPALAVLIQTTICFLCAQLSLLIGWYRAQCKLDFRGLYRVWPWAAAVFGTAAVSLATNAHGIAGQIVESGQLLQWRPSVVAWLLPLTLAASPLIILIDRDVRRSRSSLYTLRTAWILLLASAGLELCAVDLADQPWAAKARIIVPLFAVATLFVGLWLHARVVAYVCPDPPEAATTSAVSQLMAAFSWMVARLVWKRAPKVVEAEVKPKRGRKKATTDEEEETAAPKRKRKTPTKRVTKPRTRKVAEPEEEEVEEEEQESTYSDESTEAADSSYGYDEEAEESNEWEEEEEAAPPPKPANRSKQESSPVPPPYSGAQKFANNSNSAKNNWKEPEPAANDSDDDEESDDSDSESGDSNGGPDPLKGLTKRQKRELRRQNKDQQRNQRR